MQIDCNKAEDGLKTTPCSKNSLNALAIDEPLEYARLALDGEMQAWVDVSDKMAQQNIYDNEIFFEGYKKIVTYHNPYFFCFVEPVSCLLTTKLGKNVCG